MILIRPVRGEDLDRLVDLAGSIEGGGMTTLPQDRDILAAKIKASTDNFAADIKEPGRETYLLVLEDTDTGKVWGTAAVFARIGLEKAFYTYSISKHTHVSVELKKHTTHETLQLVNDYIGFAEVSSLYVAPEFRQPNVGRILARSRYLLMAQHRDRFPGEVVAEMRGWQDENGTSPFWEALGKNFFDMSFHDADHLSAVSDNQFIADLMPKWPIYVDLLPEKAQAVIGKPHEGAVPAMKLLEWEGFHFKSHVDIFDGGPCLEARVDDIRAVRDARTSIVTASAPASRLEKHEDGSLDLLSTGDGQDFRASAGWTMESEGGVTISEDLATALALKPGDQILHTPLR